MSAEEQKSEPSMLSGHVKYVQGTVSSALGYDTGNETKEEAVKEMKDAKKATQPSKPTQSGILGTVESAAGKMMGCDGMVSEGETRKPVGIEEASGTG